MENFESCEELLDEVLEKVNLVIRNQKKGFATEDLGILKTLMSVGVGKVKIELKKVNKGGGEQKSRIMNGRKKWNTRKNWIMHKNEQEF